MVLKVLIVSCFILHAHGGYLNQLLNSESIKSQVAHETSYATNHVQNLNRIPYQHNHYGGGQQYNQHVSGGSSYFNGPYPAGNSYSYQQHPQHYNKGGSYQGGYAGHGGYNDVYGSHSGDLSYSDNPNYQFKYGVEDEHTGDKKTQYETRENGVVKGSYSLVEPDGSIRTVEYTADPIHGFRAVVHKSGEKSVSYGE